jgi:cytochrome c-type biogenesis protein CcmH/NrfG
MVAAFKHAWLSAGVPMKGTTVTLPPQAVPASVKPALSTPKKESVSHIAETVAAAEPKPKKKRPRWMLVAGFIALFLCCLFVFLAIRRGGLFPDSAQIATRTANALSQSTKVPSPLQPVQTPISPDLGSTILLDDFEGAPPPGSGGWIGYFDETTSSMIDCAVNSEFTHGGANSLRFKFDIVPNSWGTCGFYFDQAVDWSASRGVTFYLRSERAGIPLHVDAYGGTPATLSQNQYSYVLETPPESVGNWVLIKIPWSGILRVSWQENPGTPIYPGAVTGFSIGMSTDGMEQTGGVVWLDDLVLLSDAPSPQVPGEATTTPELLEATRGVGQNPTDPYAHLRLAMAYWDAGQPRVAYVALAKAADLAGGDQGFFMQAGDQFVKREAWIAAAGMYQRAILSATGGETPDSLLTVYHEAVYKAAANEDLPLYLPFDSIANVDQTIAFIAEGRYNLHLGDNTKARDFLERARRLKPSMPEVTMLDAEITIKEGKKDDARQLLNNLMSSLDTPEWIRILADTYLIQNP